jgi:uncharacterized membrane protein YagU involved in acid resistance
MPSSYTRAGIFRGIVSATVIAGTLDILAACVFAIMAGGSPLGVLQGIGGAIVEPEMIGNQYALAGIGLALHFAIMAVMATVYLLVAARVRLVNRWSLLSGIGYGLILWIVMYWIVLPQRFPTMFPILTPNEVAMQLFSHIVLVGIPIALVAKRARRRRSAYW